MICSLRSQVWQICDTGAPSDITNCFPSHAPKRTSFPFPLYELGTDFADGYPAAEGGSTWLACRPFVYTLGTAKLWGTGRQSHCYETGLRITSSQPPERYTFYANGPFFWIVCRPSLPIRDCYQTNVPHDEEFPYPVGYMSPSDPTKHYRYSKDGQYIRAGAQRSDILACKHKDVMLLEVYCWGVKLKKPKGVAKGIQE